MTGDAGEKFPGYRGAIQPSAVTLAEALKGAGYRAAMSGKWHVGDTVSPAERGFDDFYGFTRGHAVDSFDPRMMIRLPEGRPQRSYKAGEYFATELSRMGGADTLFSYGSAWANLSNTPWRMYKHYSHEGGISSPPIAQTPLFFEHDGSRAVRDDKWKLVATQGGEWGLSDIDADRTELNNLAALRPDRVKDMAARWDESALRVHALPRPGGALPRPGGALPRPGGALPRPGGK
jgi:arylsulfatase A-like enzyme